MMLRTAFLLCLCAACLSLARAQTTIPERMWPVDEGGYDIVNVLLMGMATNGGNGLSDALMVLSLNRTTRTAAIVSIPRDLYVYSPGYDMVKLNQVYFLATRDGRDGLLWIKEVLAYNLGLSIDHHVMIDFDDFVAVIDALGGVEISVDCSLQDWRIKSPELDRQDEANWELFTLPIGVHLLDGETALWYARSRRSSNDLDRGRRHQDLLRATWRRLRQADLLADMPRLWGLVTPHIQTDITLDQALSFLPLALDMERSGLDYYTFQVGRDVEQGYTEGEGQFILKIVRPGVFALMQALVTPPTALQASGARPRVAVYNESGMSGLARVAADRLELEGFIPIIQEGGAGQVRRYNKVIDYVGADKGNPLPLIQRVLGITDEGVELRPDATREYDYAVYIGALYPSFACTRPVLPPQ